MRLFSKKAEPQVLSGACGSQFLILSCYRNRAAVPFRTMTTVIMPSIKIMALIMINVPSF